MEQLDGRRGPEFLEKENEALRSELRSLKLRSSEAGSLRHSAPLGTLGGSDHVPAARTAELERTVASLEKALAKASDFREQLLRVLEIPGPAVPAHHIIIEVQKLKAEVVHLERK